MEVEKVITELTTGVLDPAGTATRSLQSTATASAEATKSEEEEIDANTEELLKRLQAL